MPFSRYCRLKLENGSFSPPLHCLTLTPPVEENPSEFLDETCPAKTRGMGLPYGENCIILTSSTVLTDHASDRQIHGRAIAYSALNIAYMLYAVARRVGRGDMSPSLDFGVPLTAGIESVIPEWDAFNPPHWNEFCPSVTE